nr:MAG TPA: hypothetical protein [Caudoviricetes sp.]
MTYLLLIKIPFRESSYLSNSLTHHLAVSTFLLYLSYQFLSNSFYLS